MAVEPVNNGLHDDDGAVYNQAKVNRTQAHQVRRHPENVHQRKGKQ